MKMICNGVALDMSDSVKFSFDKDNILWAFNDLKCERSQEFKIPATTTNERVFGFAGNPAFDGRGMRKRFEAQLQDGVVVKDGYLYVNQFSKREYSAIFVTGEYVGLQRVRDAGKVSELYNGANVTVTSSLDETWYTARESMQETDWMLFANVSYLAEYATFTDDKGKTIQRLYPSVAFGRVVRNACEAAGLRINWDGVVNLNSLRVIPDTPNILDEEVRFISTPVGNAESQGGAMNSVTASADWLKPSPVKMYRTIATMNELQQPIFVRNEEWMTLMGWRTNKPITLTIPSAESLPNLGNKLGIIFDYFGGYNYSEGLQTTQGIERHPYEDGETIPSIHQYFHDGKIEAIPGTPAPIAGRKIDIPAGMTFAFYFFNEFNFVGGIKPSRVGEEFTAWTFGSAGSVGLDAFDFNVRINTTGAQEEDDRATPPILYNTYSIYDNLPDISLLDALRVIAYASGKTLTYSDSDGFSFRDYSLSLDNLTDITHQVLTIDKVERGVAKMQQHNVVEFDSGDYVTESERVKVDYSIANDNLTAEAKTIFKIPYSEGGTSAYLGYVYVHNEAEDDVDKPILAIVSEYPLSSHYLSKLYLPKDMTLQAFCDVTTTIDVSVRMTLAEFDALTVDSVLVIDGVPYSWTSGKWSKNVAKLTLVKIKL